MKLKLRSNILYSYGVLAYEVQSTDMRKSLRRGAFLISCLLVLEASVCASLALLLETSSGAADVSGQLTPVTSHSAHNLVHM